MIGKYNVKLYKNQRTTILCKFMYVLKVSKEQKEVLKQIADLRKQRNQCYQEKMLMEGKFEELVTCLVNKLSFQNK